jgi:hypothetical protein
MKLQVHQSTIGSMNCYSPWIAFEGSDHIRTRKFDLHRQLPISTRKAIVNTMSGHFRTVRDDSCLHFQSPLEGVVHDPLEQVSSAALTARVLA